MVENLVENFVLQMGNWIYTPNNQIWVFDQFWKLDRELYASVQKADWKDIILPSELKDGVINDACAPYP